MKRREFVIGVCVSVAVAALPAIALAKPKDNTELRFRFEVPNEPDCISGTCFGRERFDELETNFTKIGFELICVEPVRRRTG